MAKQHTKRDSMAAADELYEMGKRRVRVEMADAFNGLQIILGDHLPPNTIIASSDVYERLRKLPTKKGT